jgi:mevalonate pyrophosphate decarboxylase
MNAAPGAKGNASPTSFNAALALAVKMTVDPGGALKNESTAARAVAVSAADSFEL